MCVYNWNILQAQNAFRFTLLFPVAAQGDYNNIEAGKGWDIHVDK